jgi:hypothetical protein
MNTEALFLFLILLLGLVLCSFLGGNYETEGFTKQDDTRINNNTNSQKMYSSAGTSTSSPTKYDNYNHFAGSSTELSAGSTFYGENGTTATVVSNSDGSQSLQIVLPGSTSPVTFTPQQPSQTTVESYVNYQGQGTITTYYGPNGYTATVVNASNGQQAIKVTTSSGTYYYNTSGSTSTTDTSTQYYGSTGYPIQTNSYQGAYGGSAGAVTGPNGNTAYYAQGPNGNTVSGTTSTNQYYNSSAGAVTGPNGNTAYYAQGPNGNTVAGTTSTNNSDYYDTLPPGIPRSQIPPGQEDLYILKSQVVPPVCPACPAPASYPREEKCPPCPACARCPEPSFECKKVPNYDAINNDFLPTPVLNDFSQFGM